MVRRAPVFEARHRPPLPLRMARQLGGDVVVEVQRRTHHNTPCLMMPVGHAARSTVCAMAKRHKRRGGRTTPKGTRPRGWQSRTAAPPIVADADAVLGEPTPFGLMALASSLIEATTPRPLDRWPGSRTERPDAESTFLSFARSEWASLHALALAVAAMHPDGDLARRLRSAVGPSATASRPGWFGGIGEIEITGTWQQTDILGDGENVVVSWRWPDGSPATAFAFVDHNMGTLVKDAFVIPEAGEALVAEYADAQPEHSSTQPLDPATARARITEAILQGERTIPPPETDTWPACRPMLEWVAGHLREGGTGYERPEWPEADRQRLLDEFMASAHASVGDATPGQVRELADPLVWFACDYGPGDPLRWSPVSVEIVLVDWYPRKVLWLTEADAALVPDVLAGFVRFAHDRLAIPPGLTAETVDAVESWRAVFLEAAGDPDRGPGANALRLARIAAGLDPDDYDDDIGIDDDMDLDDDLDLDDEFTARTVALLETEMTELVGGRAAYEALTDAPLGEVAFDWTRVPDALAPQTAETLACLDRWAGDLFDEEVTTIARAVLAGVVASDPGVFKRSPRTEALAAAILGYLMRRLTGRLSAAERREMTWSVATQKELAAATGVSASTISSRSRTVGNVVDRAELDWPALLHSSQRREVLQVKALIAAWVSRDD